MLSGKRVVLGVSGGIAAYKACEITSRLRKMGCDVRVVMTEHATAFVAPLTFETLSGNRAYTSQFDRAWEIEHISLQRYADLVVVAPATANIVGKYARGIADDLLSTTLMAAAAPVLIAPAMNAEMYRSAAHRENLEILAGRGVRFIGPESGLLACGDDDVGRMSEPRDIVEAAVRILCPSPDLAGRRVLVTAGPTREMLDPVRFLSNRSTGKMGYAIAEAARDRGAEVVLVSGPVALEAPRGVELVPITSTQDLFDAVFERAPGMDIVVQAAAPADYRPAAVSPVKIKKGDGDAALQLTRTPDVAEAIGLRKRPGQVFVIFAAETDDVLARARDKLRRKRADFVVANDVTAPGAGFAGDTNVVTIIGRGGEWPLPMMEKRRVADAILDRAAGAL